MTVYAESNFLLELAFEQEQSGQCTELLALAESGRVRLVLPAYSIGESLERLGRRKHQRVQIRQTLREEIRELGRSASGAPLSDQLRTLIDSLIAEAAEDERRYDGFLRRLLGCAAFIPLDGDAIRTSLDTRSVYDLSPQDAIILACVLSDLGTPGRAPAVFVNRNKKDFATQDVIDVLNQLGCVLKTDFAAGLAYLRANLAQAP